MSANPLLNNILGKGYIGLDLETTGYDPDKGDQIIQLAAYKYDPSGQLIEKLDRLVMPTVPIPRKITRLTGIDKSSYTNRDYLTQGQVAEQFGQFAGDLPIMAYNANFDLKFLQAAGADTRRNPVLDVYALRGAIRPEWGRRGKLEQLTNPLNRAYGYLAREYGIQRRGAAHTAGSDVDAMNQWFWAAMTDIEAKPERYAHLGSDPFGTLAAPGRAGYLPGRGGGGPASPAGPGGPRGPRNLPPTQSDPNWEDNFGKWRFEGRLPQNLPGMLQSHLQRLGLEDAEEFQVGVSDYSPRGYTRLQISNPNTGFTGRNAMIIDIRGGPESAYGEESAIMLRASGGEKSSEIAITPNLLRSLNPASKRREWEMISPTESLARAVGASFRAASAHKRSSFVRDRDWRPDQEIFSILTGGDPRHEKSRRMLGVPLGHLMTSHYSSEGQQNLYARSIGVYFDIDPSDPQGEWLQIQEQKEELRNLQGESDQGLWKALRDKGIFYSFTKGAENESRFMPVSYIRQWFNSQGRPPGNVVEGLSLVGEGESLIGKSGKYQSTFWRARNTVTPMREEEVELPIPGGGTKTTPMYRQIEPLTVSEAVAQYGERYWENEEFVNSGTPILLNTILPGEQHQRAALTARLLTTKTPLPGAVLVNKNILDRNQDLGIEVKPGLEIKNVETAEDLLDLEFSFGQIAGTRIAAGERRRNARRLGSVKRPGKRAQNVQISAADLAEEFEALQQTGAYEMEIQGGELYIPAFYSATGQGKKFHYAAEYDESSGKWTSGDEEVLSTELLMPELQEKLEGTGISVNRASKGGVYMKFSAAGLIGGAPKTHIKGGQVAIVGNRPMQIEREGRAPIAIDMATGENKLPLEQLMWGFSMQERSKQQELLRTLMGKEGEQLAEFIRRDEYANVLSIDELAEEYGRITGNRNAKWNDLFSAMWQPLYKGLREDEAIRRKLADFGIGRAETGDRLHLGLFDKDLAAGFEKIAQGIEAESKGTKENPLEFRDIGSEGFVEGSQRITGANFSWYMPTAYQLVDEWPGSPKRINLESLASFAHSFPELAKRLGALPEQGPKAGSPNKAWMSWQGVFQALAIQMSEREGEHVEYKGRLEIDEVLSRDILRVLDKIPKDRPLARMNALQGLLDKVAVKQGLYQDPDTTITPMFADANRYLPMPEHALGIDVEEGADTKAKLATQYLAAMHGLAEYSAFGGGGHLLQAHNRFMGSTESRIEQNIIKGENTLQKLLGRMITGTVSGHYFGSFLLGPGKGLIPYDEEQRLARSLGLQSDKHIAAFSKYIREMRGGLIPGAMQRYPVVEEETGTIPLELMTEDHLNAILPEGVGLPSFKAMRGMIGLSSQSAEALQGDWDIDPQQLTSGVTVDWDEKTVQRGNRRVKVRTPVFGTAEFYRDVRAMKAAGLDPGDPATHQLALEKTMRHKAQGQSILYKGIDELMDPGEDASKGGFRTKWVPYQGLQDAFTYYFGQINASGILSQRGESYNAYREFRAALSKVAFGARDIFKAAVRSFALPYQRSLEYNREAGRKLPHTALVNEAALKFEDDALVLKTTTYPALAMDRQSHPIKSDLMISTGENADPGAAWAGFGQAITSIAGDPYVNDELLAMQIASYGEDDDEYTRNVIAIRDRLKAHRDKYKGQSEEELVKGRSVALAGMYGAEMGPYSPLSAQILSAAIEKAERNERSGWGEGSGLYAGVMIPWRGKTYTPIELSEDPGFEHIRQLGGLLKKGQRDKTASPMPAAGKIFSLAEGAYNRFSQDIAAVRALSKSMGLLGVTRGERGITEAQFKQFMADPSEMRAHELGQIVAPHYVHEGEEGLAKGGYPEKALIDMMARQIATIMGVPRGKWPGTIFEQKKTQATELGYRMEEQLARSGDWGFRVQIPKERPEGMAFMVGDVRVTGTPDMLNPEGEDGSAEVNEVKTYRDTTFGRAVAAVQNALYGHALRGLAGGDKEVIPDNLSPAEAYKKLRGLMQTWAEEHKKWADEEKIDQWQDFDPEAVTGKIMAAAAQGRVQEGYLILDREGIIRYDELSDPAPDVHEIVGTAVDEYNKNRWTTLNKYLQLLGGGEATVDSWPARIDPQVLKKINPKRRRQMQEFARLMVDRGYAPKRYDDEIGPEVDPDRTMIQPGESVREPTGEEEVMLGDESERPGDQATISQARQLGMMAPKEAITSVAKKLQFLEGNRQGPQQYEREARLAMSGDRAQMLANPAFKAYALSGEVRGGSRTRRRGSRAGESMAEAGIDWDNIDPSMLNLGDMSATELNQIKLFFTRAAQAAKTRKPTLQGLTVQASMIESTEAFLEQNLTPEFLEAVGAELGMGDEAGSVNMGELWLRKTIAEGGVPSTAVKSLPQEQQQKLKQVSNALKTLRETATPWTVSDIATAGLSQSAPKIYQAMASGQQIAGTEIGSWNLPALGLSHVLGALEAEADIYKGARPGGGGAASKKFGGLSPTEQEELDTSISSSIESFTQAAKTLEGRIADHTKATEKSAASTEALTSSLDETGKLSKDEMATRRKLLRLEEIKAAREEARAGMAAALGEAEGVRAGRELSDPTFTDEEKSKYFQAKLKARGFARTMAQQEMAEGQELAEQPGQFGARLGFAARSIFGGLGFFYLQRMFGMTLGDISSGYGEAQAAEMKAWQTSAGLFGTGAGALQSDEIERRKALLRKGPGIAGIVNQFFTGLEGTPTGDTITAAKTGLGTMLGSMFILSELAQAGAFAGAAVLPTSAVLGGLAIPAGLGLIQAGYASEVDKSISAAALMRYQGDRSGADWRLWGVKNWSKGDEEWKTAFGRATTWEKYLEYLQANPDAEEHRATSKWTGYVAWYENLEEEHQKAWEKEAERRTQQRESMLEKFGEGQLTRADLNTPEKLRVFAEVMAMGGMPFEGIDPDVANRVSQILGAAGITDQNTMKRVATATQSGIDVYGLANRMMAAGGVLPTITNTGAMVAQMPITESGAAMASLGAGVLDAMGPAYRQLRGFDTNIVSTAMSLAPLAYSPAYPLMNMGWNQYAQGYAMGEKQPYQYADEYQIARMTPDEMAEYYAQLQMNQGYMTMKSSGLTSMGGEAGSAFAARVKELTVTSAARRVKGGIAGMPYAEWDETYTAYDPRRLAAATQFADTYNRIFQLTGQTGIGDQLMGQVVSEYMAGSQRTANIIGGTLSGDLVATQFAMQQYPGVADVLGQYGITQVADVNRQGQITGLPLYTTNMTASQAQAIWGDKWSSGIGQYAVKGYTPIFSSTGEALYGTRAINAQLSDASYQAQMASAGAQMAQLMLQKEYMPKFWDIEDRQRQLGYKQQEWQFGFQERQLGMQDTQFYQNLALNQKQAMLNRQFQQEGWGYQDVTRQLGWQWKQEDFAEQARFMTGRERRLAERQMGRDTIMHGLEGEQIDKQRNQQKQLWKLEDDRFALQKSQHEEQMELQEEQIQKMRQFYEERKALEEESIKLHREYQEKQLELAIAAAGAQAYYAKKMQEAKTQLEELNREEEDRLAQLRTLSQYTDLFAKFLLNMGITVDDLIRKMRNIPEGTGMEGDGGGASGLDMIVPAGYDNDNYYVPVRSGEHVSVSMPFAEYGRTWSPWQNTYTTSASAVATAQPIHVSIYLGNQFLGDYVIDTVTKTLEI